MSDESTQENSPPFALRFILIASLALLLLATVSEYYRTPPASSIEPPLTDGYVIDHLVVPGSRIGPVTLGLPDERLSSILGDGQLRPHEAGYVHLYEQYALVVYSENERVVSATTRSPIFRTRAGIGVGDDVDTVLKAEGSRYEMEGSGDSYVLHDWSRGLHLGVEENRVSYLQVTAALLGAEQK